MKKDWAAHQSQAAIPYPGHSHQPLCRVSAGQGQGLRAPSHLPKRCCPSSAQAVLRAAADAELPGRLAGLRRSTSGPPVIARLEQQPPSRSSASRFNRITSWNKYAGRLRIKAVTISGWLTVMLLKHILPTPSSCPSAHPGPLLFVPLRVALLGRGKSDQNCRLPMADFLWIL